MNSSWLNKRKISMVVAMMFFALILFQSNCWAQTPLKILKDINPYFSNPENKYKGNFYPKSIIASVEDKVFFIVTAEKTGAEPWIYNSSTQTSYLLKDVVAGSGGSDITEVVAVDDKIFFVVSHKFLWVTDGTSAGTKLVYTFDGGASGLIAFNNQLYFSGSMISSGNELWSSDGTPEGTAMLKDLNPGPAQGIYSYKIQIDGTLYFAGTNGSGSHLFKTDGTANGTLQLSPAINANELQIIQEICSANGVLYVRCPSGIFRSDGTKDGTVKMEIPSRIEFPIYRASIKAVGSTLYFVCKEHTSAEKNYQLWKITANTKTAVLVKNFYSSLSDPPYPDNLTSFNNQLFFTAWDETHGYELWKSDGTSEGSFMVQDLNPGVAHGIPLDPTQDGSNLYLLQPQLTVIGDKLYFISDQGDYLLTQTDGTAAGTLVVNDLGDHVEFSTIHAGSDGNVYFFANDYFHGISLWKTNGTQNTTSIVKRQQYNAAPGLYRYTNEGGLLFNGKLYFAAADGQNGFEVWRTDGTDEGTILFKDINPGGASSGPHYFYAIGDTFYFVATDGSGADIWKSDGTPAGTTRLTDFSNTPEDILIISHGVVNDHLVFQVQHKGNSLVQLWSTDGTITQPISPEMANVNPQFTIFEDIAFFFWGTESTGLEPWTTDGTVPGTHMITDLNPGEEGSLLYPFSEFQKLGEHYIFGGYRTDIDMELFVTDGTEANTKLLKDICPGDCYSWPLLSSAPIDGNLYFTARDNVHGWCVYKTDGTSEGTVFIHDPIPGYQELRGPLFYKYIDGKIFYMNSYSSGAFRPTEVIVLDPVSNTHQKIFTSENQINWESVGTCTFGSRYYFSNTGGASGAELWASDGTSTGTNMLKDIMTGVTGSFPRLIKEIEGSLYFVARNNENDDEALWKTDGGCGLRRMTVSGGTIFDYFVFGNKMLLYVNDVERGLEIFYYNLGDEPALTCPQAQSIAFDDIPEKYLNSASFQLHVEATSGLPVSLAIDDPTIATLDGVNVTIVKPGTVTITAKQLGNDDYYPAEPVSRMLVIQNIMDVEKEYSLLEIYPNPANDRLIVKSDNTLHGFTVVDVYGAIRQHNDENKSLYELDVTLLPAGIYFLTILHMSGKSTVKFVKQ